jgi:L-seryl-tRNA(Ser) seleniumtransferase
VVADSDPRRGIPRTDAILADNRVTAALERLGPAEVRAAISSVQQRARDGELSAEEVLERVVAELPTAATSMRQVINATGVLVHTNLGRAPLSTAARVALGHAAGYVDIEFDLLSGRRSTRGQGALDALLGAVPGAEAALIVNNNAAALVLAATALAAGREIVISRGEMVEIGDGFRLPDLLQSTGARLHEVGTTNRTTVQDYQEAISAQTGMLLKVHPSNFAVVGFVAAPSAAELATLGPPLVVDVGSGLLTHEPLLPHEPDMASALAAGAELVMASGDKLLGGPQAGVLLGAADTVSRLRRHPLARALRADKLSLAALEATLRGPTAPVLAALRATPQTLAARATALAARLSDQGLTAEPLQMTAQVGGGGGPGVDLRSAGVALDRRLAVPLRTGIPAVVGRIEADRCLLDLRAVPPGVDDQLFGAVMAAHRSTG